MMKLATRILVTLGIALGLAATPHPAAADPGILVTPTAEDFAYLAYSIAGTPAPFDTWAQADRRVTSLDEFSQAAAAQALAAQMRARADRIKDIRTVKIEVDSQFGEYNDQYGEYDFDINDGTIITYNTPLCPRGVVLNLTNGGAAQSWSLSPADAAKILKMTQGNRSVTLTMTVQLTGATLPGSDSDPISIDATIVDYDISTAWTNLRLGHVVVK